MVVDRWPVLTSLKSPEGPLKECELVLSDLDVLLVPVPEGWLARIQEGVKWATSKKDKVEQCLVILRRHKTAFLESLDVSQALVPEIPLKIH